MSYRPSVVAAFAGAITIYAASRFFRLTESCLWFDEIFTVHAAEHTWGEILNFIALDLIHPPLFYLLLKVWMNIGGDGVFWLRLLPVLISILAIFPFIKLCRGLKLQSFVTLVALFLIATNGALIKYAQEVRMYSLLMCLSLFSVWLFVRFANRGKRIVPLVVVNVLLVYTHYFGWLVISAEIVAAALLYRQILKKVLVASIAVFFTFAPWLAAVIVASRQGSEVSQNIGWMSRPGIYGFLQFGLDVVDPFYQQLTSVDTESNYFVALPLLIIFTAVMCMALWPALTRFRDNSEQSRVKEDDRKLILLLILFFIVPLAIAFITSWLSPVSIWGTRHLTIVFAPAAILIGFCVERAFRVNRLAAGALAGAMVMLSVAGFVMLAATESPVYSWCVVGAEAEQLAERKRGGTIVAMDDLTAYQAWFAVRKTDDIAVELVRDLPGIRSDAAYFLPRGFTGIRTVEADGSRENAVSKYLILRSSTILDHRRARPDFVTSGSAPILHLQRNGLRVSDAKRLPGAIEDVYVFELIR